MNKKSTENTRKKRNKRSREAIELEILNFINKTEDKKSNKLTLIREIRIQSYHLDIILTEMEENKLITVDKAVKIARFTGAEKKYYTIKILAKGIKAIDDSKMKK